MSCPVLPCAVLSCPALGSVLSSPHGVHQPQCFVHFISFIFTLLNHMRYHCLRLAISVLRLLLSFLYFTQCR